MNGVTLCMVFQLTLWLYKALQKVPIFLIQYVTLNQESNLYLDGTIRLITRLFPTRLKQSLQLEHNNIVTTYVLKFATILLQQELYQSC